MVRKGGQISRFLGRVGISGCVSKQSLQADGENRANPFGNVSTSEFIVGGLDLSSQFVAFHHDGTSNHGLVGEDFLNVDLVGIFIVSMQAGCPID